MNSSTSAVRHCSSQNRTFTVPTEALEPYFPHFTSLRRCLPSSHQKGTSQDMKHNTEEGARQWNQGDLQEGMDLSVFQLRLPSPCWNMGAGHASSCTSTSKAELHSTLVHVSTSCCEIRGLVLHGKCRIHPPTSILRRA